jgi:hypothetical protein
VEVTAGGGFVAAGAGVSERTGVGAGVSKCLTIVSRGVRLRKYQAAIPAIATIAIRMETGSSLDGFCATGTVLV